MTLNMLVVHLRAHLELMKTDAERHALFERLTEGYCRHCGRKLGTGPYDRWCACTNDE